MLQCVSLKEENAFFPKQHNHNTNVTPCLWQWVCASVDHSGHTQRSPVVSVTLACPSWDADKVSALQYLWISDTHISFDFPWKKFESGNHEIIWDSCHVRPCKCHLFCSSAAWICHTPVFGCLLLRVGTETLGTPSSWMECLWRALTDSLSLSWFPSSHRSSLPWDAPALSMGDCEMKILCLVHFFIYELVFSHIWFRMLPLHSELTFGGRCFASWVRCWLGHLRPTWEFHSSSTRASCWRRPWSEVAGFSSCLLIFIMTWPLPLWHLGWKSAYETSVISPMN